MMSIRQEIQEISSMITIDPNCPRRYYNCSCSCCRHRDSHHRNLKGGKGQLGDAKHKEYWGVAAGNSNTYFVYLARIGMIE